MSRQSVPHGYIYQPVVVQVPVASSQSHPKHSSSSYQSSPTSYQFLVPPAPSSSGRRSRSPSPAAPYLVPSTPTQKSSWRRLFRVASLPTIKTPMTRSPQPSKSSFESVQYHERAQHRSSRDPHHHHHHSQSKSRSRSHSRSPSHPRSTQAVRVPEPMPVKIPSSPSRSRRENTLQVPVEYRRHHTRGSRSMDASPDPNYLYLPSSSHGHRRTRSHSSAHVRFTQPESVVIPDGGIRRYSPPAPIQGYKPVMLRIPTGR